jgi:hypothetical protein
MTINPQPFVRKSTLLLVIALLLTLGLESYSFALSQPSFYRGIYLNSYTSRSNKKMSYFIKWAPKYHINAFVMDVQKNAGRRGKRSKKVMAMVSTKMLQKVKKAGIWPIARIVVFDQGFDHYPIDQSIVRDRLKIARKAAQVGFPEIQFDYIRFADNGRLRHVGYKKRYAVIEGFLKKARKTLKPYNTLISADVFGRIPLNRNDLIGQRMEGLAQVVDIISPMAYPSHYTWSRKLMADPRHTVYITSHKGKKRVAGQAEIVTWIQGFKYKYRYSKHSFVGYIKAQIHAVEQAKVRGFLVWNAAQRYRPVFRALRSYYSKQKGKEN